MIGEDKIEKLYEFRLLDILHPSEVEFIDFLIQKKRLPDYRTERKQYDILLRLKKKYKRAKDLSFVLSNFLEIVEDIKISNKLTGVDEG